MVAAPHIRLFTVAPIGCNGNRATHPPVYRRTHWVRCRTTHPPVYRRTHWVRW
ncbi:hypothetical protein VOLCADRAFT_71470 [Volvox carteri f. nagariensis]|uniref:Uncharacterized protein n=1 Tax=Volvox carteri f. nagariensis TaxID=3068 RepID=D8ULT6_VOLCA|nr:uncharacterized protein VOLCADRAFT_71470 [Volvox carteri f. nagariensis]EFJ39313.1 hypothetical protein VOLCADRAFT_71470 [Volvox carteri f. nagariensis]|eukprot:XP_002959622.1 hypothetical protein VOLCADRAFT_71470 [Volvox carteri f. nagariensis]